MDDSRDLAALARSILDTNLYMTLGTADEDGTPWVSPVFYATADHTVLYWISSPEVTHSRNIAVRPEVSIVVFDSTVPAGEGKAVYMRATAAQPAGDDVVRGLAVYPGPLERGGRVLTPDEVQAPGPYRLYAANVSEHSVLCPREAGQPCAPHGRSFDHRTNLTL